MSEQPQNEQAEPTNLDDTDLDEVTGGGTGSSSVIRRNGRGYSKAQLT